METENFKILIIENRDVVGKITDPAAWAAIYQYCILPEKGLTLPAPSDDIQLEHYKTYSQVSIDTKVAARIMAHEIINKVEMGILTRDELELMLCDLAVSAHTKEGLT